METSIGKILYFCKLGWALGREIERYKREREEEMRKERVG
jgi:hypothetical protein